MSKIVILQNNGGRLANQIWQYSGIYAYSLESGLDCVNYSFWQYQKYFNLEKAGFLWSLLAKLGSRSWSVKALKLFYAVSAKIIRFFSRNVIVSDGAQDFNLPPSALNEAERRTLAIIDPAGTDRYYFCGWLFRNPAGLEKYRAEIKKFFQPRSEYLTRINEYLAACRRDFKTVVGVHIRRGDYRTFADGRNFYDWPEVRTILNDFLQNRPAAQCQEIVFLLCSDEPINEADFAGLNYRLAPGDELLDLYLLAGSDLIIGANSTYGAWASYYGGVPLVNFSRDEINWSEIKPH
jgi:hypothetical protein